MRYLRSIGIVLSALLAGACVQLGEIQQTTPVRTLKFTGSHTGVAQCVHDRLGGRLQRDGERLVIYDAVKGERLEGLTHWAISVSATGPDAGLAEWRVKRAESAGRGMRAPRLSEAALQQYWRPVQDCAAQVKAARTPKSPSPP